MAKGVRRPHLRHAARGRPSHGVHVALCTSITVLLPSRKNPKAFTTYSSDLATYTSPYFHSCRISGSKNLSNFSGIEEMKSEVST